MHRNLMWESKEKKVSTSRATAAGSLGTQSTLSSKKYSLKKINNRGKSEFRLNSIDARYSLNVIKVPVIQNLLTLGHFFVCKKAYWVNK